jgi:hypothetical protein
MGVDGRRPRTSLEPLSRGLRHFQQINLYHSIVIVGVRRLAALCNSLKASGLGGLVYHIHIRMGWENLDDASTRGVEKALIDMTDLLPHLRSVTADPRWRWQNTKSYAVSEMVGNIFLDGVGKFEELESVDLSSTTSSYLQLLEMEKLKEVSLVIDEELSTQEQGKEGAGQLTRLSLDKLSIRGHFSPLAINFVQSIDTVDISLDVENGDPLAALTAISRFDLSRLSFLSSSSHRLTLTSQLDRFWQLQHLNVGGNTLRLGPTFFTKILRTSLPSLAIALNFDLNAKDLIDGIVANPNSKLSKLELNNFRIPDYDQIEAWKAGCTTRHVERLISLAKSRNIELTGETMSSYEFCMKCRNGEIDWENVL